LLYLNIDYWSLALNIQHLTRKKPRDFVWRDEFQASAADWPKCYPGNKVWMNIHEYKAALAGDASYLRILISGDHDCNLVWETTPDGAHELQRMVKQLPQPLEFTKLQQLGFSYFTNDQY
jgi:hypothetical protein